MTDFAKVLNSLAEAKIKIESSQLTWVPQSMVSLDDKEAFRTMRLTEALEELEDVQEVFTNLDMTDELIARYEEEAA
jgi:transcriptional/translational regulatory protein YebC/TACO1